jgi:two-component system LytT family response regulator
MIRVLVVDDEKLARLELKRLLSAFDDVEVVGEARDGKEALAMLRQAEIDLAFVDIQMPGGMDGLDVVGAGNESVNYVFCTAFGEHAAHAFELSAFDYIVKPIAPERLAGVIDKARQHKEASADQESEVPDCLPDSHGLLLKFGADYKIVRLGQIFRFQSVGNHVSVFSDVGHSFIHASLSKVETRLDPSRFFKASRSDIIRIDRIDRIEEGMAAGTLDVIMRSGDELTVSRRQAHQLRKLFSI